MPATSWAEAGRVPDMLVRLGIRQRLRARLREVVLDDPELEREVQEQFLAEAAKAPIAPAPERANAQHYELPEEFFARVLGPRLKYSCALWNGAATLADAEEAMLERTCQRAQIADGMQVLDLGCGWGALTLWVAERHPDCRVLGVSNAARQREFIEARARALGLSNVAVVTADINDFMPDESFDRVVSIEMFEHLRNHPLLLARIARWLRPGGRLFVHHFSHRSASYAYQDHGEGDWMARHFFTGGMMPADDYLLRCQEDLVVEGRWRLGGAHYRRTCEAWLENLDRQRAAVLPLLARTYGAGEAGLWLRRWRLFFLACAELFGFRRGTEWGVTHLRFRPASRGLP